MKKISELFKKKQFASAGVSAETALYGETRPDYDDGFDQHSDTIVRLVSSRKSKKPYQVKGIDDLAAKNNWKGWLYLAPVLILVAVFLIYPLVNTIFIAFTENYQYATGKFDGFTINNFGVILNLLETSAGGREEYFVRYAIPNTFLIVFITVPISTFLALIISV